MNKTDKLMKKYLSEDGGQAEKIASAEAEEMSVSELESHIASYEKHMKVLTDNLRKFEADPDKKKSGEGAEIYKNTKWGLQVIKSSLPVLKAALQRKKSATKKE